VPRIELWMSVLAGFAGGLVGTLWNATVSAALLARGDSPGTPGPYADSTYRLLTAAMLYGACGAVLGLLFWLSWGLVAVVATPWAVVGAAFGAICWAGGALPMLGMLQLRLPGSRRLATVLALEWLVACLAIGVFCAFAWHRSA
jgi:hypothetical protein